MECAESGCEDPATFELHIPWSENEFVCSGHARIRDREEGVVADPLPGAERELPTGAARKGNDGTENTE